MIMDDEGNVLDVNKAFTNNFGYNKEDIIGKNFSIFFTASDKEKNKPRVEVETVVSKGQAADDNYVIDKNGHAIICTGETILAYGNDGEKYLVKDIVNLQSKKQIQLFLTGTDELLERIFESTKDMAMMILNGSMKVQKVNSAFLHLFELEKTPEGDSRLSDLDHPFWNNAEVKNELRKIVVTNVPVNQKDFLLDTAEGKKKTVRLDSKIIDRPYGMGRKIFIILEDVTPG